MVANSPLLRIGDVFELADGARCAERSAAGAGAIAVITMWLPGPIKPYVRMTQRSRYVNPEAREYIESRNTLRDAMRALMLANGWERFPRGERLAVVIQFWWCRHNQDIDNLAKAVLDAANGVIYEDDCWIDSLEATRGYSKEDRAMLFVRTMGSVEQ